MAPGIKVVHYLNQFFFGLGGEEKAGVGVSKVAGPVGPGLALQAALGSRGRITATVACGDNYFQENEGKAVAEIIEAIGAEAPDVVVAGPAFNAGRYGLACAAVCLAAKKELGIPAVTAMSPDNPAVQIYVQNVIMAPTTTSAAGMKQAAAQLAELTVKLAGGQRLGAAETEGYIPTGHRYNEYRSESAAARVVEMLHRKLAGEPFVSEIPLRGFEKVPPAPPVRDLAKATIALVTGGGIVPKGNPDQLKQAFSTTYGAYDISHADRLEPIGFIGIHGGYDCSWANDDPNRVVPLDELRAMEKEGRIGRVYERFFTTSG
ncbi:MAG TPA: glycine/betaine/sarcosine/D-proline family reductase selenoprotein B, partial [Bacillota bacterium]